MADALKQVNTITADNVSALAQAVRDCAGQGLGLVDYGVAHRGLGNPPPVEHVRLEQRGAILEHYERDYTVRAAAGIRMGDLQAALLKTRQFLPLEADDDLTLGEVINHHVYGGLRASYGSIRDLLLGLGYVDGQGREIRVGGRTVKNVAGYDLTRFMVGSLGELGVLSEATVRTYAVPEQTMTVEIVVNDPIALDGLLPAWLLSDAAPAWMVLNRAAAGWTLNVGYFGRLNGCVAQVRALETILAKVKDLTLGTTTDSTLERDLAQLALRRAWRRQAKAMAKVVVPPAMTGAICRVLAGAPDELFIDAMPIHGCLFVGGDLKAERAATLDRAITLAIQKINGLRSWYARPAGAETIAPFAPVQPDWLLLRQLKKTMDPGNLFNPGRFLGTEAPKR